MILSTPRKFVPPLDLAVPRKATLVHDVTVQLPLREPDRRG